MKRILRCSQKSCSCSKRHSRDFPNSDHDSVFAYYCCNFGAMWENAVDCLHQFGVSCYSLKFGLCGLYCFGNWKFNNCICGYRRVSPGIISRKGVGGYNVNEINLI